MRSEFCSFARDCGRGVVCCLPKCGLKDRDACQLSQEPMRDAEQVQDGAQLEHGEELRACACEHSVSRESCCGRLCMSQTPSGVHCRNDLYCSESTLQTSSYLPSMLQDDRSGRVPHICRTASCSGHSGGQRYGDPTRCRRHHRVRSGSSGSRD